MRKKFSVNSIDFIAIISAYFAFALNVTFWQFAFKKVEISSLSVFLFCLSLPFFIYIPIFLFFCCVLIPRFDKILITILLIFSASSDYAQHYLGILINSDMIRNFAETNMREALDFFTLHSFCYVLVLGIVPALLVWRTHIHYDTFVKEVKKRFIYSFLGLLVIGIFASISYKEYASFGRNNSQVRYYINTLNYIYAVGRYYKRSIDSQREFVTLDANPQLKIDQDKKPQVIVLLVGETARAQNFSLYGYPRETNPRLSASHEIVVFNNVESCGTSTAVSVPCMFSHLSRKMFDVTDAQYTQNLLDIAQSAGYDVYWVDNDDGCKKVCNRVQNIDAKEGNKQPYCFGNYCQDDILLSDLEERLKHITKNTLIVLHMMGSHGPSYYKRYPAMFKKFKPDCDTANLQDCTTNQIVNSYDNTILYTDYIIDQTIQLLKDIPDTRTAMLYVSDHGESLGENNLYLHGLPYMLAPDEQKKVPMILWISPKMRERLHIDMDCLKQQASEGAFSHDNYFHSILRLLSIQTTTYDEHLDILNMCHAKS